MNTFSIGEISSSIILPLRYYFSKYSTGANLIWNEDEKLRTMDIYEAFDFNRVPLQEKPRVVVSRGGFRVEKLSITDNLAFAPAIRDTKGNTDRTNFVIYRGQAMITIEARNKGTCELLADMVTHFLIWTRPIIMDAQGWKDFALPMDIGDCLMQGDEDPNLNKFQVQIAIPWAKEELWNVRGEGPELKRILQQVVPT